jgi:hypothetical protein
VTSNRSSAPDRAEYTALSERMGNLLILRFAMAVIAATVAIAGLLLLGRARGAAVRITALALILLALANPSFTREDREPLSSVAAVVIDKSPSQNFGERTRETAQAKEALVDSLKKIAGLEVRVPVQAGSRVVGVSFVRELWEPEGLPQPTQRGRVIANDEVYMENANVASVQIGGPYGASGPSKDTASRRAIFVCQPPKAVAIGACVCTAAVVSGVVMVSVMWSRPGGQAGPPDEAPRYLHAPVFDGPAVFPARPWG